MRPRRVKGLFVIDAVYEMRRGYDRVPRLWHTLSTMHLLMKIVLWQRKHSKMMVEDLIEQFSGISSKR